MGTEIDVLQVITSSARRGAERFAVALEPELIARGSSVRTVALVAGPAPALDVEVLGRRRLGPPTLLALRRAVKKASVVVAHGSSTLPATALAASGTDVPFVYRNIGDPAYWATNKRRRTQTSLMLGRSSAVVALTPQTAQRISDTYRVPASKISPIPRGISPAEFAPRTPESFHAARAKLGFGVDDRVAVCIGALSPEKNILGAVQAIQNLPSRWHLIIAGDGPDRASVEQAVGEIGGRRIRLLGSIDDPGELLRAADLLLLPSLTEGLPGVVIEAAMVGVPAVVTNVGFVTEIVEEGVGGMIVPADDPPAMAAAALAAEPRLADMGLAAQTRVAANFALPVVADAWHDLLGPLVRRQTAMEKGLCP